MTTGDELIGPFAEAVAIALREMAGVEAVVRGAAPAAEADGFSDVSAVLRLSTGGEGYMVLSLPSATAAALATRILADVEAQLKAQIADSKEAKAAYANLLRQMLSGG